MHLCSTINDTKPGKIYSWRGAPVPFVCWYLQTSSQANIFSRPHNLSMTVWYDFHWHHLLRNWCMKLYAEQCSFVSLPISYAPLLHLPPSYQSHSVLTFDGNCLASPLVFRYTELITTDWVQCVPPWMTGSSAALESSKPSESCVWLGTKDVALMICNSYS